MKINNTRRGYTQYCLPKGFTLIELLVVVLIIGILAAVAVPQYQKAVNKERGIEVLNAIDAIDKKVVSLYLEDGDYKRVPFVGIDAPQLNYFGYTQTDNFYLGTYKTTSHLQLGTGGVWTSNSIIGNFAQRLTFLDPDQLLVITANWDDKTNLRIICKENHGKSSPACEDFFNCTRTSPRTIQVLCGKEQWTMEECYIK